VWTPDAETTELRRVMSLMLDEAIEAYPADEQPDGSWWLAAAVRRQRTDPREAAGLDVAEKAARAARRARDATLN
jgi:hypothetical protein